MSRGTNHFASGTSLLFGSRQAVKASREATANALPLEYGFASRDFNVFWQQAAERTKPGKLSLGWGSVYSEMDFISQTPMPVPVGKKSTLLSFEKAEEAAQITDNLSVVAEFGFVPQGKTFDEFSIVVAVSTIDSQQYGLQSGSVVVGWFDNHPKTSLTLVNGEFKDNQDLISYLETQLHYWWSDEKGYEAVDFSPDTVEKDLLKRLKAL